MRETLEEILSSDDLLNRGIEWHVFGRLVQDRCPNPECGVRTVLLESWVSDTVKCSRCETEYIPEAREFPDSWDLVFEVVERLKEMTLAECPTDDPCYDDPFDLFVGQLIQLDLGTRSFCLTFWNLTRRSVLEAALRSVWRPQT